VPAIAGGVRRIAALRNDPFQLQPARMPIEGPAASDLVIAELQRRPCLWQQRAEPFFPLLQRLGADSFAIEVEQIEQEKDKRLAVPRVRCILNQAEGGRAVRPDAAQLSVEIGLSGRE
jgi:hypothetical protein